MKVVDPGHGLFTPLLPCPHALRYKPFNSRLPTTHSIWYWKRLEAPQHNMSSDHAQHFAVQILVYSRTQLIGTIKRLLANFWRRKGFSPHETIHPQQVSHAFYILAIACMMNKLIGELHAVSSYQVSLVLTEMKDTASAPRNGDIQPEEGSSLGFIVVYPAYSKLGS